MRFGILNTTLIIFICLNFQLSYSQDVQRTSEIKRDVAYGQDCDDTEYRNEWGTPNWKNYGKWLSECDSIRTVNLDKEFAERDRIKRLKKAKQDSIDMVEMQSIELDLDAMWENTVWEEIQEIGEEVIYETEYITAVAGVRGAEAEDEALEHLYYRKSMKGLAKLDIQKALGKLILRREKISDDHKDAKKIDGYISQLKLKLKKV
tara:strand:+ start:721 stop:1335 length:615 start_codon:yes stop_codon:yes gene_type:complete